MHPRHRLAPPLLIGALLLTGCDDPPEPPPQSMKLMMRPVLGLNVGVPKAGAPEKVVVLFHPEQMGPCHPIPSVVAKLDGVELTRLRGKVKTETLSYNRDCNVFEYELTPWTGPTGPTSTLEVTDGESTARMVVDNLFAPRTVTPEAAEVPVGGEVVLTWSPATDVFDPKADVSVILTREGESPRTVQAAAADGKVRFTLPADLGAGPLSIEPTGTRFIQPHVAKCDWVVSCTVSRAYTVAPVAITVK